MTVRALPAAAPTPLVKTAGRPRNVIRSLAVASVLACTPAAGEGLLQAVSEGVSAAKRLELEADSYVTRWRVAGMDSEAIFGAVAGAEPLAFNLFGDVEVRARVQSAKTLEGGSRFLAGVLEDGGHFTLFRHSTGIVRGEFHLGEGVVYALRSQSAGRMLVTQGDVSALPGCGNGGLSGGVERLPGSPAVGRPVDGFGAAAVSASASHSHQHSGSHGLSTHSVMHGSSVIPAKTGSSSDSRNAFIGMTGKAGGTEKTAQASQNHAVRGYSIKKGIGNAEETARVSQPIDVLVLYTQRVEDHEGGLSRFRLLLKMKWQKLIKF